MVLYIKSCTPGISDLQMQKCLHQATYKTFISYEILLKKSIYDSVSKYANERLFALQIETDGITVYIKSEH